MKIDSSSSSFASRSDLPPRRPAPRDASTGAARPEAAGDAIELSPEARRIVEFPSAEARARADLVARLRQEVDAGTYRPDADAVARRLAERLDRP